MFEYFWNLLGYFWRKEEKKVLEDENTPNSPLEITTEKIEGEVYECMKPNPEFDVCIEELEEFLKGIKSHCCIIDESDDEEPIFNIDDLMEA